MVDVCLAKARRDLGVAANATERADPAASSAGPASVSVRVADAANTGFEPRSFDTVVDTFGLCSFEDPVAALREMARVCRSEEVVEGEDERGAASEGGGGGRIFLLEHGRSASHAWLSNILDHFATAHAERWGCYWNRDILALVREAGLEVVEARAFHLGTTHWIVAKPGPGTEPRGPGRSWRWGKKKY
jgi:methyltransferase OMS1